MREPQRNPQLFHEALLDFLNALDLSIERIAPFAGLHPQQLRRLGKDGKHHTLSPSAITRLLDAPALVGKTLSAEQKEAWEKHLKTSSLYTVLLVAAHRRTNGSWPKTKKDRLFLWEAATDLAIFSRFTFYRTTGDSYQTRETKGFPGDSTILFGRWSENKVESEEDILLALKESDKISDRHLLSNG